MNALQIECRGCCASAMRPQLAADRTQLRTRSRPPAPNLVSLCGVTIDAIDLHCINPWEVSFLRQEVGGYFAHGIELAPGATVLDVGSNIGVFSAAVYERLGGDAQIYAFGDFFDGRLTALPYGLASGDSEPDFSYFPAATIFSSSLRDQGNVEAERRRVTASIVEMIRQGGLGPVLRRVPAPLLRGLVGRRLRVMRQIETHRVRVRPLSVVLDEQGIEHIDLLKIDVEGAELDVLRGIEDRHWPLIGQAVVEVEGWRQNCDTVREVFTGHGFTVSEEQGPIQEAADIGMLFAVR
jgi:hypothetical protein